MGSEMCIRDSLHVDDGVVCTGGMDRRSQANSIMEQCADALQYLGKFFAMQ